MPRPVAQFDAASVRESWDAAADVYAEGQAHGRDYYRYDFFGPAHLDLCTVKPGARVLDVGCGNGYFARLLAERGAHVTGIDISPRMIEHAARHESARPLGIDYRVVDAVALDSAFAHESFDLATSCLALQDMPRTDAVLRAVHAVLKEGAHFVVSMVHPCTDMPVRVWERDERGNKRWLCIDRYFDRGPLRYAWKGWAREFTTEAMHATLEDWMTWIVATGFELRALKEPRPTEEAVRAHPDLEDATRVPYFLLLDLMRR